MAAGPGGSKGKVQVAALLLAAGARVDRQDKDSRRSPLHVAAAKGYGKICALLLEKGADANSPDKDGRTPLYYADRYQQKGISALLKGKGAKPAEKEKFSVRPWLTEPLADGQAVVWYLGHSGWAVKTRNHLLIFDYWKQDAAPDEPGLANGTINPEELKDLDVTVFASTPMAITTCRKYSPGARPCPGPPTSWASSPRRPKGTRCCPTGRKK